MDEDGQGDTIRAGRGWTGTSGDKRGWAGTSGDGPGQTDPPGRKHCEHEDEGQEEHEELEDAAVPPAVASASAATLVIGVPSVRPVALRYAQHR